MRDCSLHYEPKESGSLGMSGRGWAMPVAMVDLKRAERIEAVPGDAAVHRIRVAPLSPLTRGALKRIL